ncbi:hypothetical protein [Actinoplanes sp. NPDC026619]|uniref:hypothetical protein n=1 Tax=Actinoplanes sp. NPDC026619 TaxID=3155798 RepID=UPI0033CCE746
MIAEPPVPAEYAYLIILQAEDRELSNTEMDELYKVRLVSPTYEKLNSDGWVASDTKRRPYRHAITAKGRKALTGALPIDASLAEEGEKRSRGEKQLFWASTVAQQKLILSLQAGGSKAEPVAEPVVEPVAEDPADLEGRIRGAYLKLAGSNGAWVDLVALRTYFRDVSKEVLDKALVMMFEARQARLEPDPLRSRIGAAQRAAAVHVDGEDRHKLAIGRP